MQSFDQTRTPRRRRALSRLIGLALLFSISMMGTFVYRSWIGDTVKAAMQPPQATSPSESFSTRKLLAANSNCTPRAINEFPQDFFTEKQRRDGGVIVHIVIALYICAALAIVCDDYFVSSIEVLCETMRLKPDVAGATFMAAGSSAPELFTSVVGVYISENDVGPGTIVGSAVFNVLCIIALIGLFAGMTLRLYWYPLLRDCLFYLVAIITLIITISDGMVHWYESVILLVLYALYITLMVFNERVERAAVDRIGHWFSRSDMYDDAEEHAILGPKKGHHDDDADGPDAPVRFQHRPSISSTHMGRSGSVSHPSAPSRPYTDGSARSIASSDSDVEEPINPFYVPDTFLARTWWLLMFPVSFVLFFTCPDCRRGGTWRRLFALEFGISVVYIALMTYVLVWMVTIIGDTLGIPDTIMALTFLAAGTSIPDALSSVFVARDGSGDMAVSNSIGSNVFDIFVCLGLPWFLITCITNPGKIVPVGSGGLVFSSIILLGTVVFLILAMIIYKWKLDKKFGVVCLAVYAVFITLSCLSESNVFGYVNPPPCR